MRNPTSLTMATKCGAMTYVSIFTTIQYIFVAWNYARATVAAKQGILFFFTEQS